jgi:hypothetical protein
MRVQLRLRHLRRKEVTTPPQLRRERQAELDLAKLV